MLKSQPQQEMSLQEVLDSFSHIELTEDEYRVALIEAKRKKEAVLKEKARKERAEENRRLLMARNWNFHQTKEYMLQRAKKMHEDGVFENEFVLDEKNEHVFNLLCYYFSNDEHFNILAHELKVSNPSLKKGILLAGNFGVGKTWLMSLFRKNNRQVYHVEHAKPIAKLFHANGEESVQRHYNKIRNAIFDSTVLFQEHSGLCIEDIGREDIKNNYGNKTNVVGDIMEARYINKCMGIYFHATTNFTVKQLGEFYGDMLVDRFKEHLNLIELSGPSRRK